MSLPNQIGAFNPELELYDRALDDGKGVRMSFGKDQGKAKQFQMRMHQARSLDRQKNRRVYERDDPKWGTSAYDKLIVRVREDTEGDWWVYVELHGLVPDTIESLSEVKDGAA